jgi:hypothetical protein
VDRAKIRGRISEDIHERQRSSLGIDEEDWYVHVGIMVAGPPDGRLCTSRGSTPFSSSPMPVPPLAPTPAKRAEDAVAAHPNMPERALAEKFGVSRGTVRNARQKLKSQAGENPVSETVETDARESQWCSSMPISARPICSGLRS